MEREQEGCALQKKHAAMLHRLATNEDARLQKFAARRAGFAASEDPNESTDRFLQAFSDDCKELEKILSSLQYRIFSESDKPYRKSDLDLVAVKLSKLEQFIAENSFFLPAYEVRASQSIIASLREKLEAANAEILPEKRFSFKSKPNKDRKATQEGSSKSLQTSNFDLNLDDEAGKVIQESHFTSWDPQEKVDVAGKIDSFADGNACQVHNLEHAVVVKDRKDLEGAEVLLENLVNCTIYVRGTCRAIYAHKLKGCKVYAGPITGSALIDEVEDCILMLASHQIRIHHAKKTDVYLRVRSRPIVEYTKGVRFAPYTFSYEGIEEDLFAAGLMEETGLWKHVDDFRWLRATPSPNWSILPEKERVPCLDGSGMSS